MKVFASLMEIARQFSLFRHSIPLGWQASESNKVCKSCVPCMLEFDVRLVTMFARRLDDVQGMVGTKMDEIALVSKLVLN